MRMLNRVLCGCRSAAGACSTALLFRTTSSQKVFLGDLQPRPGRMDVVAFGGVERIIGAVLRLRHRSPGEYLGGGALIRRPGISQFVRAGVTRPCARSRLKVRPRLLLVMNVGACSHPADDLAD
jgi:hypothetical protein